MSQQDFSLVPQNVYGELRYGTVGTLQYRTACKFRIRIQTRLLATENLNT
jgi:hypothetical protein